MDIFFCPLCQLSFESILRPIILPCRHFLLCRNCLYAADSYTCETCCEQFYYSNLSVDETLDEWLERAKKELDGVAREDGKWTEYEQFLREYLGERKEEREVDALVDVSQWPVSDWLQGQEEGQWTCEVCSAAVSDTRYRCTSCGRVNFAAFQALHREKGDTATALAQQIIQLTTPQLPPQPVASLPQANSTVSLRASAILASQPPEHLPVASPNTASSSPPVSIQAKQTADPPKPVPQSTPIRTPNPSVQASVPLTKSQIPAEASLPADANAIIPLFPPEQAPLPLFNPDQRKIPEDRHFKPDRKASKQCCSLF